jgi:CBS domain-containing protein
MIRWLAHRTNWLLAIATSLVCRGAKSCPNHWIGFLAVRAGYLVDKQISKGTGMSKTAREIMSSKVECVGEGESLIAAAEKMARLDVGALPVCGEDDRLKGMLTDRDIVVKVLASGKDPHDTKAGELAKGKPVTIGADDSAEEALRTMSEHKVRRLPVIDGHELIGVLSQGDLAGELGRERTGELLETISS